MAPSHGAEALVVIENCSEPFAGEMSSPDELLGAMSRKPFPWRGDCSEPSLGGLFPKGEWLGAICRKPKSLPMIAPTHLGMPSLY